MAEEDFLGLSRPVITPVVESIERKAEAELEAQKPTLGEAIKASVDEDWIMSWAMRDREEFLPDPDFQISQDEFTKITSGLPEDYHGFVEDAVSPAHLQSLREEAIRTFENDKKLEQLGWRGVGVRFGVALADPAAIGVSMAINCHVCRGLFAVAQRQQQLTHLLKAIL